MITFSKIMAGCDFSKYSKLTLEYAASLAEKCQAKLIIVNIINQRDVINDFNGESITLGNFVIESFPTNTNN